MEDTPRAYLAGAGEGGSPALAYAQCGDESYPCRIWPTDHMMYSWTRTDSTRSTFGSECLPSTRSCLRRATTQSHLAIDLELPQAPKISSKHPSRQSRQTRRTIRLLRSTNDDVRFYHDTRLHGSPDGLRRGGRATSLHELLWTRQCDWVL